jgi:hypothetical protein
MNTKFIMAEEHPDGSVEVSYVVSVDVAADTSTLGFDNIKPQDARYAAAKAKAEENRRNQNPR